MVNVFDQYKFFKLFEEGICEFNFFVLCFFFSFVDYYDDVFKIIFNKFY